MGAPFRPDQLQHILKLFKAYLRRGYTQKQAHEEIAQLYGRHPNSIKVICSRLLADTTDVARSYFKSNALKMAMKVVREGSVAQHMDILERPNIGVLAPKKQADGGSRGFFLTVTADSCGAVKVGAAMIEGEAHADSGSEIPGEDDQLWEESQARLRGESGGGGEEPENGEDAHPRGIPAGPDTPLQGFSILDGHAEDPSLKDVNGHFSFAKAHPEKMAEYARTPRGPGRSPTYLAAVERARKRLEDAKKV